jgi:hypothetical protein
MGNFLLKMLSHPFPMKMENGEVIIRKTKLGSEYIGIKKRQYQLVSASSIQDMGQSNYINWAPSPFQYSSLYPNCQYSAATKQNDAKALCLLDSYVTKVQTNIKTTTTTTFSRLFV